MPDPKTPPARSTIASLVIIAAVVAGSGAAFAYTAGWLSPDRLSPEKFIQALTPPTGPALGHRRNHAKGVCFTGEFVSNGAGAKLSSAKLFAAGSYPVTGRFNLGTPTPTVEDATVRVRGLSIQVKTPDGQEWRSAMINPPFFAAATPADFLQLLQASGSKDKDAPKRYAEGHPEFGTFVNWVKTGPWTASYAEERYNSLNSFVLTGGAGGDQAVRWSFVPEAEPKAVSPDELKGRDPSFLEADIADRIKAAPAKWKLVLTLAKPGDPTGDPTKVWPDDRETVEVGELVASKVTPEPDGPCRDLNFDPTVLPTGMKTSDDPFPAARSAVYQKSFDKRTAEASHYPGGEGETGK